MPFVNAVFANPNSTTSAQTGAQAVTTGNLMVVMVGWAASGVSVTSVTDTAGNTYQPLSQQASSTFAFGQMFYAYNVNGNAANRVTVNFSSSTNCRVYAMQFSGMEPSAAVFDEEANIGAVGTAATAANVTIPDNGVLVAAAYFRDDRVPVWDAAFTARGDISNITVADQIVTTGLTDAAQLSWNTSAYVVLCSAVFKAAGGGGPTPPNPPTGVTVSDITRTSATVMWTDASGDEDGFDVEIAASPFSSWTALSGSPTAANDTSEALAGLTEGETYKVRVRSFNENGASTWAESASFKMLTRYLKIGGMVPASIGETSVAGVVWATPAGSDIVGAKITEFTGKTIVSNGGAGSLRIPVSELGGALAPGDAPRVYLRTATHDSPIFTASVADEE